MTHNDDSELDDTEKLRINMSASDPSVNLRNGIFLSDGDGSIPLLSLGGMCAGGWQYKKFNPSQMRVVTREYMYGLLNCNFNLVFEQPKHCEKSQLARAAFVHCAGMMHFQEHEPCKEVHDLPIMCAKMPYGSERCMSA